MFSCPNRILRFSRRVVIFTGLTFFSARPEDIAPATVPVVTPAATPPVDAKAQVEKKKFHRRVLLTLFVNDNRDENRAYLRESIPEAFSAPLIHTGNFVMLNRKSIDRYMEQMGIPKHDLLLLENAVRLGKAVGADVIVLGKFVSDGKSVMIEAKAVDVQAGRFSVEDTERIETNTSMFDSIKRLAERMSLPMAEKMQPLEAPPPAAEVVLDEEHVVAEVKKIEEKKAAEKKEEQRLRASRRLWIDPGISVVHGFGGSENTINYDGQYPFSAMNPGFSIALTWQSDFPEWQWLRMLNDFQYAAALSYAYYAAALNVTGTTGELLLESEKMRLQTFGLVLSLAKTYTLLNFPVTAYAGISIDYASFAASQGETLYRGIIPGIQAAGRVVLFSFGAFEAGALYRLGFNYLNEGNSYLYHMITISGGYRL